MKHSPERQHNGKRPYRTKGAAKAAISRLQRTPGIEEAELLDVYKCPYCAWWHIGRNRTQHLRRRAG